MEEELGVIGGDYEKTVTFYLGPHLTGRQTIYFVTNFQKMKSHPDPDEILYELELPIKGLYNELSQKHMVTAETLLIAKLLEERFA